MGDAMSNDLDKNENESKGFGGMNSLVSNAHSNEDMQNLTDQWGVAQAWAMSEDSPEPLLYLDDDVVLATSEVVAKLQQEEAIAVRSRRGDGYNVFIPELSVRRVTRVVVDAWNEPGVRALVYLAKTPEGEEYFDLASGVE